MRARPLVFVVDPEWELIGSAVMRGRQLSEYAADALRGIREVRYDRLGSPFRNADLFLTKGAGKALTAEAAARLKRRGNRLFLDIADSAPPDWADEHADAIVAASRASFAKLSAAMQHRLRPAIVLVDHHPNPRIPAFEPPDAFRAGYFGELFNTIRSPELEQRVDFHEVTTKVWDDSWLELLPEYSLHFAVRRRMEQDDVKPLTKAFVAARCGANLVIGRDDPEVPYWFPADYPYLTDTDEASVLATLDRARADFGSSTWRDALGVMAGIADQVSPEAIKRQLLAAFG